MSSRHGNKPNASPLSVLLDEPLRTSLLLPRLRRQEAPSRLRNLLPVHFASSKRAACRHALFQNIHFRQQTGNTRVVRKTRCAHWSRRTKSCANTRSRNGCCHRKCFAPFTRDLWAWRPSLRKTNKSSTPLILSKLQHGRYHHGKKHPSFQSWRLRTSVSRCYHEQHHKVETLEHTCKTPTPVEGSNLCKTLVEHGITATDTLEFSEPDIGVACPAPCHADSARGRKRTTWTVHQEFKEIAGVVNHVMQIVEARSAKQP